MFPAIESYSVEMNTIEDYKILKHLIDQNTLKILMENMMKMDTEWQNKPKNDISILKLEKSFQLFGH